eukprot:3936616-Rhodomonas_salina.2
MVWRGVAWCVCGSCRGRGADGFGLACLALRREAGCVQTHHHSPRDAADSDLTSIVCVLLVRRQEMYHVSSFFDALQHDESINILKNLTPKQYLELRAIIIRSVRKRHSTVLSSFSSCQRPKHTPRAHNPCCSPHCVPTLFIVHPALTPHHSCQSYLRANEIGRRSK